MTNAKKTAFLRTFGCQQNVSDSEKIKGILAEMGYAFSDKPEEASLILFNTCAVRENAEHRVFGNVGALKSLKSKNPNLIIGICGCMTQQPQISEKIKTSFPYVDLVFGTHALPELQSLIAKCLEGKRRVFSVNECDGEISEGIPILRESKVKALVPIMYGCDNFCTYCVVPLVRGRERSRNPESVLDEIHSLIDDGCKDITLLGQNVNSYGKTLEDPITFSSLLRSINAFDGDFRIRFMTSHPKDCTRELIDTVAECQKVCKHIHLPVQSGSDRVLSAMNRGYTSTEYLNLIDYAKSRIPGLALTSDIIVGFPGEERRDFLDTLRLVKQAQYQSLFTFVYSKRDGTKSADMDDYIPHETKMGWFDELLMAQGEIGQYQHNLYLGKILRILPEEFGKTGEGYLRGRSESNIIVEFLADESMIGRFVDIRITKAMNWALLGEVIL